MKSIQTLDKAKWSTQMKNNQGKTHHENQTNQAN